MSPFGNFPKESITLVKQDGSRVDTDAVVSSKGMIVYDVKFPVESGDTIERGLPSGVVERYEVTSPGYSAGLGSIPAHFNIKVRPKGSKPPEPNVVHHHNYNNSGQVAAMGPQATASNNVMLQQVQQPWSSQEVAQLAGELSRLRKALATQLANLDEDADPGDDSIELGHVAEAEKAAKKGDQAGLLGALKRFGRKTWQLAEHLGFEYLKLRAGDALGLPPGEGPES